MKSLGLTIGTLSGVAISVIVAAVFYATGHYGFGTLFVLIAVVLAYLTGKA